MRNTLITAGVASGLAIILWPIAAPLFGEGLAMSEWLGYLVMLLGLSIVFVAVKRYRDVEQGGTIRFSTAFSLGLGISLVASVVYVLGWEVHLALTDYAFLHDYTESLLAAERESGASAEALAEFQRELEETKALYRNPLFRVPITFLEIFPVGILVSLVSAAVLRNPAQHAEAATATA